MLRKMDARDASMPVPCSCVILAGFSKRRYLRPGELQVEARPRAEACGRDSDPAACRRKPSIELPPRAPLLI